jgi:hypothetical protein
MHRFCPDRCVPILGEGPTFQVTPYPGGPLDRLTGMDEHDPFSDQDNPETRRRLRALGSAPLGAGVADRVLASVRAAGRPKVSRGRIKLLSAAAVAGFAAGGVGLAAADVLPAPVQEMAHGALNAVGVHVPPGHVRYNDPVACPGGPYSNHGAYVRAHKSDPKAGESPCGKPVQSVNPAGGATGAEGETGAKGAKGKGAKDKGAKDTKDTDNEDQGAGNGSASSAHGNGKPDDNGAASTVPANKPAATTPSSTGPATTNAPTSTSTTSTTDAPTTTTSTTQP